MTPQQLKNSILQYAIQGKLVEQRKEEGTAEQLYKKIQEEKQRLIKEGKIKKQKAFPEITEEEIPFDIPESWIWVRLGDLGDYKKGPFGSALTKSLFVQKSKDTVKVYEQKNAIKRDCNIGDYYITKDYFENKMMSFEVLSGDIIVSCAGTIGETYVLPNNIEQGIINQALMRIRIFKNINIDYFLIYFETILKKSAQTHGKGSAIKNIPPFDVLKKYTVALPPLEEQKRIVAKIEKLLPLVDDYAKSYEELEKLNKKFPEDMKKSILQYAIQGELVEQRKEEGTAEELYKQIQEEKQRLIKEGEIKKQKALSEIIEDEIPFDIPESWKWVKFGDIVNFSMGKTPPRSELKWWGEDIPWVSISDMSDYGIVNSTKEKITEQALKEKFSNISLKDTLIMSFKLTVGRTSILGLDAVHNEAIISIYPFVDFNYYFRNYLFYILPLITQWGNSKKAIKGNTLNSTSIFNLLVPIPPLEEQKRIVDKIEELLLICENLNFKIEL
ncbi:MAG: restriction endonuclease subunit S [Tissierellia bacterium]|nr:restriction endonuclease subunit S [Tissierellia bacterium]